MLVHSVSQTEAAKFQSAANEALQRFPCMQGQCVAVSAWIVERLRSEGVLCRVALGTLRCRGRLVFEYQGPIPRRPKGAIHWSGHAWVDFQANAIGEVSLFRTARRLPSDSNLRNCLDEAGFLQSGAMLSSYTDLETDLGLKYKAKSYLHQEVYEKAIEGLEALNV